MKIKICGLTKPEEAEYLNRCGVDFAGVVLFYEKSRRNQTIEEAGEILKEYEEEFMCWMIFQQSMPQIERTKEWMLEEAEKKGFSKAIDKLFYRLREQASPRELEAIFRCLGEEL